ncbi:MAG: hypothetical protein KBH21_07645 [Acetoanaerobium sp.]|nr:hypothetical protein [Acetoanaerobium sp.]
MIKFKTRTGSSSILVILLVVTMVVFGVLAMMSSYSGLKMARKTAQWTQDYYELESKAEIMLYDIKNIVHQSIVASNTTSQDYWTSLNRALRELDSSEVTLTYDSDEIIVKGDFVNSSGDRFLALLTLENLALDTDIAIEEDLIEINTWKLIPREVEYEDAIEFKDLEVNIEND